MAYGEAQKDVRERPADPVPLHIRNAPTSLIKDIGYGKGYQYAHDAPDALRGREYYRPTNRGLEAEMGRRLSEWRKWRAERRERS